MANRRTAESGRKPGNIIARHPRSEQVYRAGVAEGINWAERAGFDATSAYAAFGYEDVRVRLWRVGDGEAAHEGWHLAFTSRFVPPEPYAENGLPDAGFSTRKYEVTIFWMGWLDGVKEVAARHELAPLMAASTGRILVMQPPRPGECPVCWVERNLGVKVVIRHEEDQAMTE